MHRMAAWRKPSAQKSLDSQQRLYDTGHDDDGEKYGGKTLMSVLNTSQVEGSVVVARWFGGVMLGPVRFDHIRNCALVAIDKWRIENEKSNKRIKAAQDEDKRAELIHVLPERDRSITVLRGLLADKKRIPPAENPQQGTPSKVPNYSTLPLAALEKLERARDATLTWILKEIEKVEASGQGADIKEAAVDSHGTN